MNTKAQGVIDYWYSDRIKKQWFASTPELDKEILDKYESVWEAALAGDLDHWCSEPEGCLALVIILDQFPLNMFRGQAKSFQSESKSVEVAQQALDNGFAQYFDKDKLAFLFMPFMHAEDLNRQELSVSLFKKYELEGNLRFAQHHRDIITKYGRFPHRNSILGRESTQDELNYLVSDKAFKG